MTVVREGVPGPTEKGSSEQRLDVAKGSGEVSVRSELVGEQPDAPDGTVKDGKKDSTPRVESADTNTSLSTGEKIATLSRENRNAGLSWQERFDKGRKKDKE